LRGGQEELSALFAGQRGVPMEERFTPDLWGTLQTGSPVLNDALVSFDGKIIDVKEVGTHSVLFVEVLEAAVRESNPGLVYFHRGYRSVHPTN